MENNDYTRREFLKQNSLAGLGAVLSVRTMPSVLTGATFMNDKPSILVGSPIH
ncbi:MAG: twin-arginine translocation signal domain-containing protein [Bacteroidales bacterium]